VLTGPQFLVAELSVHDRHASPSEHARHPLCQYRCLWQRAAGNRAQRSDLVTESHQQVHHTRAMDNDKNTPFNSLFFQDNWRELVPDLHKTRLLGFRMAVASAKL